MDVDLAPEIVKREGYDYRVDLWSVGICLYELLTGHTPFKGDSQVFFFFFSKKDHPTKA